MSDIEWCDETWGVAVGCSAVSDGCRNCYAQAFAHRGLAPQHRGLTRLTSQGARWLGQARFVPEALAKPLRWKKPRKIFVASLSDLFHSDITNEQIAAVFGVMAACPQHTFMVLTKRPERMRAWFEWVAKQPCRDGALRGSADYCTDQAAWALTVEGTFPRAISDAPRVWPLPNVMQGVSTENQETANERIPLLIATPAAVRFVSAEPLLGPIDFEKVPLSASFSGVLQPLSEKDNEPDDYRYWTRHDLKLSWVIVGGESGPGARACNVEWIRSIVKQCADAGVPCFVKQVGARPVSGRGLLNYAVDDRKGGAIGAWPEDIRVRQWPEVRP